jgi:hypothetical protein
MVSRNRPQAISNSVVSGRSSVKSGAGAESVFCSSRLGQEDRTLVQVHPQPAQRGALQEHGQGTKRIRFYKAKQICEIYK